MNFGKIFKFVKRAAPLVILYGPQVVREVKALVKATKKDPR